jgi:hypothetical protein
MISISKSARNAARRSRNQMLCLGAGVAGCRLKVAGWFATSNLQSGTFAQENNILRDTRRDNGHEPGNPFACLARVAVGVLL